MKQSGARIVPVYAVVTRKAKAICIANHDANDVTKYIHMANHKAWQPLYSADNNVSYKYSGAYADGEVHQLHQVHHRGMPVPSPFSSSCLNCTSRTIVFVDTLLYFFL